ncbi:MAG: ribokinase [Telmatospirillum sp.]|nr:ribokinase [Telmatospirillum sp.]
MKEHPEFDICVFGSVNADVCVYAERAAGLGETRFGDRYALNLGGKGANQAIAAHRLGAHVRLLGNTGDDIFGAFVRQELARFGVATDLIGVAGSYPTGMASILVDAAGRNAITVVAGANLTASEAEFKALEEVLKPKSALLLQCERSPAANLRAARKARNVGACVVLDPAPVPSGETLKTLAGLVDIVTPNETETEALTGIAPTDRASTEAAADALHGMGFRIAVLKLGARGAFVRAPELRRHVAAPSVACVDSVAAGDCFNAALATRLCAGSSIEAAVRYACAAGALSVSRPGAAASAPTAAEIASFAPDLSA